MKNKNIKLEFIRSMASILVFLCHLFVLNSEMVGKDFGLLSNWGTEAVLMFFVLSGVVISITFTNNSTNVLEYLKRRIVRIYPIFIIGLLTAYILLYLFKSHLIISNESFVNQSFTFSDFIGNLFFLGTLEGNLFFVPNTNVVLWSLSFEMFFYLFFGINFFMGPKSNIFLIFWVVLSIISIPFYYMEFEGLLGFLVSHFSFSLPWLIGFLIHKYRYKLNYFNLTNAIFFTALLPAISRLSITTNEFCILKYTLFSLFSVPLFIYSLNVNKDLKLIKNKWLIPLKYLSYGLLIFSIIFISDSRNFAKIFYLILPFGITFLFQFNIINFFNSILLILKKISIFFGGISYGFYIVHFPIILVINFFNFPLIFYVIFSVLISVFCAYVLEKIVQPWFQHFFINARP